MIIQIIKKVFFAPRELLEWLVNAAVAYMATARPIYSSNEVSDCRSLKKRVRVGDVLLISGSARISYVVKVLTVSQWSHVVMYVGDRQDLLSEDEVSEWSETFGDSALKHLVIDADPIRGVHLKPLDEYIGLLIRHCRPEAISSEDLNEVLQMALNQLGKQYDIQHVARLMVFFALPWEFLPTFLRRFFSEFRLSESDTICSRVLSEAFHSVGYPIRPYEIMLNRANLYNRAVGIASGVKHRGKSALRLFAGGRVRAAMHRMTDKRYTELHLKGTRYITPSDYDLSRFFSVIKDTRDLSINYRSAKIQCPLPMPVDEA